MRVLKIVGEQVALGIDVGGDVMGDLRVVMTDADAAIEGRRAKPDRAALLAALQNAPEADMIAPVRAFADRLLEGKVLAPAVVIKMTDRRSR